MPDDPSFKWCRRVFASVDVAGSTAFKQRSPHDSGRWAHIFKLFFDEFPTTLRASFEKLPVIADGKPATPMAVWKFVGDEILFAAEIARHEEVAFHVIAFREAINEYTSELKRKPELAAMSLKGTIWGAGFPVTNAEVATRLSESQETLKDYIGPCVDQGFRLCALADSRRIPISVDIAYMLAKTTYDGNGAALKLQCEEPKSHKGVPYAYPHIWVDRGDGTETPEDRILGRRSLLKPGDLEEYLEDILNNGRLGILKPFLVEDPSKIFNKVPEEMRKTRERLLEQSAAEQGYSAVEPAATGTPGEFPPAPTLGQTVKVSSSVKKLKKSAKGKTGKRRSR